MVTRARSLSLRAKVLAVTAFVIVLGAGPAWAYWTAQSSPSAQPFNLGHLDVTASKSAAGTLDVTGLMPGQSAAQVYRIANGGSIPLSFYVNGWATGDLGAALRFTVTDGSSVTTPSPSAVACTGTQLAPSATSLPSAAPGSLIAYGTPAAARATLLPSAGPYAGTPSTTTICVQALLPTTAANALQGATATVNVQVVGEQVAQP
jgi:predicted ribosomally synthesized peptide with SipW-like signal peptide